MIEREKKLEKFIIATVLISSITLFVIIISTIVSKERESRRKEFEESKERILQQLEDLRLKSESIEPIEYKTLD